MVCCLSRQASARSFRSMSVSFHTYFLLYTATLGLTCGSVFDGFPSGNNRWPGGDFVDVTTAEAGSDAGSCPAIFRLQPGADLSTLIKPGHAAISRPNQTAEMGFYASSRPTFGPAADAYAKSTPGPPESSLDGPRDGQKFWSPRGTAVDSGSSGPNSKPLWRASMPPGGATRPCILARISASACYVWQKGVSHTTTGLSHI